MASVGIILIIIGGLIIRQVWVGRATDLPGDARDLINALLTNNPAGIKDVGARRGTAPTLGSSPVDSSVGAVSNTGGSFLREMQALGSKAAGYRWGAEGPTFYDCSGLVSAALNRMGIKVGRLTTSTFPNAARAGGWAVPVTDPKPGDVVLWQRGSDGHIGVVTGPDQYYSALSTKAGVVTSRISGTTRYGAPTYWRFVDARSGNTVGTYSQN